MNFTSSEKIASVIDDLKTAELKRSPNRTLINDLFNGLPPWTPQEVKDNHIQVNVNWGEGSDLLLQGREQLENANLSTDFAFKIQIPDAPKSKATKYAEECTKKVNRLLKRSLPYLHINRQKWASVILHGPGSQMWEDQWKWRPYFVGIDDLLIPTDTELTYEDLNHFAVRRRMTRGQLFRKTFGLPEDKRDPGWQMKSVQKILDQYKDQNQNNNTWNWADHPEKAAEIWKQNATYYDSDSVPVIWMWDFYYQEDEEMGRKWYKRILLDSDCVPGRSSGQEAVVALYEKDVPFANSISQILHTQFIDGNNIPPFMYHCVRGLGPRLFSPVHMLNRTRCQALQKTWEDMMNLFRAQDPIDRARLDQIYMGLNYGIIPDGLSFVTRDQRYQIDPKLLEMTLSGLKQLIGEGSQQYTQDIDTGTPKERTAFEVSTLLNQTTKLTGSMLNLAYLQEGFAYQEICRRLTLKGTQDWEAKKLQADLIEAGVPEKWIDSEKWEIEPVRVLGSGNAQLEQGQAQALLNVRPMLNPEAQNEVMHDYVYAITHDPKRANRLAPLGAAPHVSDTVADTERVYGAIMAGSKVNPRPGLIAAEVVSTIIGEMGVTVQTIMQQGGIGTPQIVQGLQGAAQYAGAYLQQMAQDKTQQQAVKQFSDQLGQLMNLVKSFAQRQQEMMQKRQNGQPDPAMMAQLQADQMAAQQKLQADQQKHEQNMTQKQQKFEADMARKNTQLVGDSQRKNAQTMSQIHNQSMSAAASSAIEAQNAPDGKTTKE